MAIPEHWLQRLLVFPGPQLAIFERKGKHLSIRLVPEAISIITHTCTRAVLWGVQTSYFLRYRHF